MKFVVLDYSSALTPGVEAEQRKKLVIEQHGHNHVSYSCLFVVNDWLRRSVSKQYPLTLDASTDAKHRELFDPRAIHRTALAIATARS
jgi:hypothetical protein